MYKITILVIIIFGCISCNENNQSKNAINTQTEKLPENLFVTSKPLQALSVGDARNLKPGNAVKVFGKVMGRKSPFVNGYASFIIGDENKIAVCTDKCGTPWDACCDDKKTIASATLSVQVLNENGKPLKTNMKGQHGLKELSIVVVEGKVDPSSTEKFMIVNATNIYVE